MEQPCAGGNVAAAAAPPQRAAQQLRCRQKAAGRCCSLASGSRSVDRCRPVPMLALRPKVGLRPAQRAPLRLATRCQAQAVVSAKATVRFTLPFQVWRVSEWAWGCRRACGPAGPCRLQIGAHQGTWRLPARPASSPHRRRHYPTASAPPVLALLAPLLRPDLAALRTPLPCADPVWGACGGGGLLLRLGPCRARAAGVERGQRLDGRGRAARGVRALLRCPSAAYNTPRMRGGNLACSG